METKPSIFKLSLRSIFFIVFLAVVFVIAGEAVASFGITPPYVKNKRLTRGSSYEQKITLVRGTPSEALKAEITINAPGIEDWISIDKGMEFMLPEGVKQFPIIVSVNVPDDADYNNYKGAIRIRTSPLNPPKGAVSIALGAQIDVDIDVVDKVLDFTVRKIKMGDLEEGHKKWGLFFPGKIKFFMTIENTGNAKFGPTKVKFEIYDNKGEELREVVENRNKIKKIAPFEIEEVVAEFPTTLSAGKYLVKYTIFKKDEVAQQGEINLSISALGTIPGYEGYGFMALSWKDKMKILAVFVVLLLIFYTVFRIVSRNRNTRIA